MITLSDGHHVRSRVVVLACGVDYRALDAPTLEALTGRGVFYGAAVSEAPSMAGRPVFVIGGGNSAGQAALHLAKFAKQVTLLVRGAGLAASMSDYLIEQIRGTRNIDIIYRAAVVGGDQVDDCLASIEVRHLDADRTEVLEAGGLFVLIGSDPRTDWLDGTLQRDDAGFLRTGTNVDTAGTARPRVVATVVGDEPARCLRHRGRSTGIGQAGRHRRRRRRQRRPAAARLPGGHG